MAMKAQSLLPAKVALEVRAFRAAILIFRQYQQNSLAVLEGLSKGVTEGRKVVYSGISPWMMGVGLQRPQLLGVSPSRMVRTVSCLQLVAL